MSFIGILIAVAFIIIANLLEGGHPSALLNFPAFLIVIGGTIGAVCVQFPFSTLKDVKRYFLWLIKPPNYDYFEMASTLFEYSEVARKQGYLALEEQLEEVSDPFLKETMSMIVDGVDKDTLIDIVQTKMSNEETRLNQVGKFYEAMGGYSPTMGILGAVLGLIHAMGLLDQPEELGHGIAVAFVATIYGVAFANIIFLPIGNRYKLFSQELTRYQDMIVEVAYDIINGAPTLDIRNRIVSYVDHPKFTGFDS